MLLDFAPLEGITGALFRRLHHEYFPGVDRYYTPFFSPTADRKFTPKEQRELFPEYNAGLPVIPQLLTKTPADFIWAANELCAMGYQELNLNFGCPSGTVTAKGKGAGMLSEPARLDEFLDCVFTAAPCKISVKTRLGIEDPEEFHAIMDIYQRYPICELIIHPRVRKDFYRHSVRKEAFEHAYGNCSLSLTYNGSIVTPQDWKRCASAYPKLQGIMIGQGLVSDPFLAGKIKYGITEDAALLQEFHDRLFSGYCEQFQSRNNAAKRMKELWFYLSCCFEDCDKLLKKLLKSSSADEFKAITAEIFAHKKLLPHSSGRW